jgi:hypothetical protein
MRDVLARYKDKRITIQATVLRFGSHTKLTGRAFQTILLGTVETPEGVILADHCWVYFTKALRDLYLYPGDRLQATARVRVYRKGYVGLESLRKEPGGLDYTLEHLQDCACIQRAQTNGRHDGDESG